MKLCFGLLAAMLFIASAETMGQGPERHRITTADALKQATFKLQPEYPATARQLRLVGSVDVDVEISPGGLVDKVTLVSGNVLLANSVVFAVKRWKFVAAPAPSIARLSFTFTP